jgi:putative ABC transport system permease protein
MGKVALRGLLTRKLRLGLTALAIALGVTLIAGTYVFTDTINRSFDRIFAETNKNVDTAITPREPLGNSNDQGTQPTVPASLLGQVRRAPGVAAAAGGVFDQAVAFDDHGDRLGGSQSPSFVSSVSPVPRFQASEPKEGRLPRTPREAAIDVATAKRKDLRLGQTIVIQGDRGRRSFRLVGFTTLGGVESFGGATVVDVQLPVAQALLGKVGRFDTIQVAAKAGVSAEQLTRTLRAQVGRDAVVRTGEEEARSQSAEIKDNLGFLNTALLVFAGISLFVGAFIIFNTFSITIVQRMREFALLRTLGASRGQVLRSVLGEGAVLGLLGSLIGLGLGVLTAIGLRALFKVIGVDLPSSGSVIATRTVVVSLLVGVLVTILSTLVPAVRATRVVPVIALREGAVVTPHGPSRKLTVLAVLLTAVGVALMCVGLFATGGENAALSAMGGGAAATFLGVALLSPYLVRPMASGIGRPFERTAGIVGRLARGNTSRLPGRTAATAAALMVGVALVTFASIFAAGIRETINRAVDQNLTAELVVQSDDNGFSAFPADAVRRLAQAPQVQAASPIRFSEAKVRGVGGNSSVTGVDAAVFTGLYKLDVTKGGEAAVRSLTGGRTVMLGKGYAESQHLGVGDVLRMRTPDNGHATLRVTGIYDDKGGLMGDLAVDNRVLERDFGERKDAFALVKLRPGEDAAVIEHRLSAVLDRSFPGVEVLTADQFKKQQSDQVNQLLGLIYALLSLAIIVAFFGIVNTLVLSISERTRELGMLRAIGTSRRQVRRMVRLEAVITSLIGATIGAVLGVVLAVLFTRPLDDFVLTIPVGTLLVLLVLAAVAGVVAAVLPARRASRLDVLQALAYE